MAPQQHVTTILLAEFDIDQGSVLAHQYPSRITSDNHVLAELMLPDGAHLRTEDWTIFFLNQAKPAPWNGNKALTDNPDGALLYVLNLVRTNHDATVRRGAAVKAMAICTTHQYLHVYKPVLLLALENYFKNPSVEVLKALYESVNSMELNPPQLSHYERTILRSADGKDLFHEKFLAAAGSSNSAEEALQSSALPSSSSSKVDGLGIVVSQSAFHRKESIATLASGVPGMTRNRDCQYYETKVTYDGIKLPIRVPLSINQEEFSLIKLIMTFSFAPAFQNPIHPHLDSNGSTTHPVLLLMNALLTGKRIVFLGNGHPAGDVANYVLAACALGSGSGGVLHGFPERAYPYTNLAGIDHLLTCESYIAGVTNQLFEDRTAWWDVLCNIDTGKITVSKDITPVAPVYHAGLARYDDTRPLNLFSNATPISSSFRPDSIDNEFIADIMNAINNHLGEMAVRAKCQEYVTRFVQLASHYEAHIHGQTTIGICKQNTPESTKYLGSGLVFQDETSKMKELAFNANRIEGWRGTTSYKYLQRETQIWLNTRSIRTMDLRRIMTLLRTNKPIPSQDVARLYRGFLTTIVSDEQINEFLSHLPLNQGGLFPIAYGLFHPLAQVRDDTTEFLNRLAQHPTGRVFVNTLNKFERTTYERLANVLLIRDHHQKQYQQELHASSEAQHQQQQQQQQHQQTLPPSSLPLPHHHPQPRFPGHQIPFESGQSTPIHEIAQPQFA
ncbi:hypothetical protein BGZ73_002465 [Actinomortierella ambigua]|nr:hypothetical protein BGZ73_002465 [Actinomortierella ambigua]